MAKPSITMGDFKIGRDEKLTVLAGPCQLESLEHSLMVGGRVKEICDKLDINYVYKSSFDKANRSSIYSARGPGMEKGLEILSEVKAQLGVPIVTDIHEPHQCAPVAEVVDMLQIPAYLCRQTDLLIAAAKTGAVVNVKKGQFLAPWDMKNVANKLKEAGCERILLCERGTCFGYNTLVNDYRGLQTMEDLGHPVVFDATHSVQQPGGQGDSTGGQREFVATLARAAVAVGVAAVFLETHQDPDNAPCDGPNMVYLDKLEELLSGLNAFHKLSQEHII